MEAGLSPDRIALQGELGSCLFEVTLIDALAGTGALSP